MKVLVCGGRKFADVEKLDAVLNDIHDNTPISLIIQGQSKGADALAKAWARRHHIMCHGYAPDWKRYGNRAAGPIRNQLMLDDGKPDLVVAFPGGNGTADMATRADQQGFQVMRVE